MRTTPCSTFVLSIALLAAAPVTIRAATLEQAMLGVQSVTRAGTLPFEVGPRETAINATARQPQSLHLADISVLRLHDRTVKLRFTMASVPLPPFSTTGKPGQALVSVRVNRLRVPRPQ
jgi:hypothetical protein